MTDPVKKTTYDPDWQEKYADQIMSASEALKTLRPGNRVFLGSACSAPRTLIDAMCARTHELRDVEIIHMLTQDRAPYAQPAQRRAFRVNSFFISDSVRETIQQGAGDYTPIFLSDIPRLMSSGQLPLDVALIQVSPPDPQGLCSFGISVDIVKTAAENASLVIAEVNPNMPRTHGDSAIHVYDLDLLVPVDTYPIEVVPPEVDEETRHIGECIAALVEDDSTLEFGIGAIPQAVLGFLKDKKNLGIHTEMFSDSIIELIESGAVNGSRKTLDREKVVASFCMGTRRLYDYIDNNPVFSFQSTDYVNDPFIIAQQQKQVAINVALEVDLTGQVCADSIGSNFYSGIGGQLDFNRGAARSRGGKAVIALHSTAKNGAVSRIVSSLTPGGGVVTTRGDVHYVVTEYGVAYLHGKTVQERAIALIAIAHPDFRHPLLREAIDARYITPDMARVEGKITIGPKEFRTTYALKDGTQINFRPIEPTDEDRMRDLFYALSQETIYYRFMSRAKQIQRNEILDFVFINHRSDVAIVATVPEAYGEDIIAVGRYYLDETTNMAEIAFVVRDDWQNKGIGSALFNHLAVIAKRNGIRGFTAEVLRANRPMQRVFEQGSYEFTRVPHEDCFSYQIIF